MKNASVAHPILEDEPGTAATRSDVSWIPVAIVLALVAALFFANLGARVLWSSEGRWAEIAREMRLNANYFWPTINGKLYYDKPLLTYWFVVGASYLTGGVNEAASRLPCAISALVAVVLTMAIAARLYSRFIAVASSLILATSYSFVFFARHASASRRFSLHSSRRTEHRSRLNVDDGLTEPTANPATLRLGNRSK